MALTDLYGNLLPQYATIVDALGDRLDDDRDEFNALKDWLDQFSLTQTIANECFKQAVQYLTAFSGTFEATHPGVDDYECGCKLGCGSGLIEGSDTPVTFVALTTTIDSGVCQHHAIINFHLDEACRVIDVSFTDPDDAPQLLDDDTDRTPRTLH